MTNNPTIDGVSRERIAFIRSEVECGAPIDANSARDLLKVIDHQNEVALKIAPAVERQDMRPDEITALQSTIARLEARVAELESGRGEPVAYVCTEWMASGEHATHARREPTHAHTVALYTGNKGAEKYDDVLLPFLAMMRAELHANAHKGDRPGWLQMDSKTAILEVFYHMGKLHQAVHRNEAAAIKEYAADVANMCMMLLDVCACLDATAALNGPAK